MRSQDEAAISLLGTPAKTIGNMGIAAAIIWMAVMLVGMAAGQMNWLFALLGLLASAMAGAVIVLFVSKPREDNLPEESRKALERLAVLAQGGDPGPLDAPTTDSLLQYTDTLRTRAAKPAAAETTGENRLRDYRLEIAEAFEMVSQLVASIEQITSAANHLSDGIIDITGIADTLHNSSLQVAEFIKNAVRKNDTAIQTAQDKSQAAGRAVELMLKIKHVLNSYVTLIEAMGGSSHEIGRFVEIIKGIASQTNLLALNAAIEAARAG